MTTFKLPDWDWGTITNKKLDDNFTHDQKDFLCEYLINEMPVTELVMYLLEYMPIEIIRELADDIGVFTLDEENAE